MTNPITPPPKLVEQWVADWYRSKVKHIELEEYIIACAAQWGADQELEACCGELPGLANFLRAARRPKPPSLKEQALEALDMHFAAIGEGQCYQAAHKDTIRRALEALND